MFNANWPIQRLLVIKPFIVSVKNWLTSDRVNYVFDFEKLKMLSLTINSTYFDAVSSIINSFSFLMLQNIFHRSGSRHAVFHIEVLVGVVSAVKGVLATWITAIQRLALEASNALTNYRSNKTVKSIVSRTANESLFLLDWFITTK